MGQFNVNKQDFLSTLTATEYNQLAELNNAITLLSGQNLDNSTLNQIAKTIIASSLAGNYYNDSGTADNYILSSATFTIAPSQYYNGMVVRFITTNTNATTTPTINVSNLGAKNIKKPDGSNVVAGDINGYIELRYNGTEFLLSPISSVLNTSATNKGLVFLNQPITIANNTTDANNDIDFTAGNFQFSDNSGEAFASAMTKRLDASWSAGNNGGGLDTGTKQANTWYHCYAIYNPTTQASDFLFSASATSPTLPTDFTKFYLIESIKTNSSNNILPFYHNVNQGISVVSLKTKPKDIDSALSTTLTNYPITTPLGRSVLAKVRATFYTAGSSAVNILSPFDNILTPAQLSCDLVSQNYTTAIEKQVITNTSSQISVIASAAPVTSFTLYTYSWQKIN